MTRAVACAGALLAFVCGPAFAAGPESRTIEVDGQQRSYDLHVPEALPAGAVPLVLVFHGGGGQGRSAANLTHFAALADRERFLVAFPDGLGKHWSDGRVVPQRLVMREVDDIAFISALLDDVAKAHAIDPHRIYATGISNGGVFINYLALRMSDRIAAIAPVAGGIAEELADSFHPAHPVSVFVIQGSADPIMPYNGGTVMRTRGRIVPTVIAVGLWVAADGIDAEPRRESRPALGPEGCQEDWRRWSGGRAGTDVEFLALVGGGHTWPHGLQYLPKLAIGKVCMDFDATNAIWEFFKAHPKPVD